jgi:acetyltransferase AlgX (SGNH hydrolase-like protein)
MPQRKIIKWIAKVTLILFVSVVLLEVLMIVTDPHLFKDRFEYDPDLGFRASPYFRTDRAFQGDSDEGSTTNRFGFNDRDYPLTKEPGVFRILVVGDSFGWAGGLNNNYTNLLENLFERRDGSHKIDVVNTGYPGTHTGEQLMMLKKFGLQYNPDLVILGFFAGNDFIEADPNRKRIVVNKYFLDIDKHNEHRLLGYPIVAQSRLLLFLRRKYESYTLDRQSRKEGSEWAAATGQPMPVRNLPEATFYNVERGKLEFFNKKTAGERFGANTRYIFESISEMNELLKSKGIKFMVAIFPDEIQVNPIQFNSLTEKFRLTKEDYDLNLAQDLLRSFLESKQIPFVDMLDRFRTEEKQRELYLFRNTHWNYEGNKLAAQILYEYLNRKSYDSNLSK